MAEIPDEMLEKIVNTVNEMNEKLSGALPQLEQTLKTLKQVNNASGATARYEEYRNEIKVFGWDYIKDKHNPAKNCADPAAQAIYNFYEFVYNDMVRKGEIDGER